MMIPRLVKAILLVSLSSGFAVQGTASQHTGTPSAESPPMVAVAYEIFPKGGRLGDHFEPVIEAGETAELTVVLANTGSVVFEGRTYAINAFSAVNGGFEAAAAGTPPSGPTRWLDYWEQVYTIEPGTGIERPFTVTVPEETPPGQYLTAIAFENADPRPVEGSDVFNQIVRFPMPVFITVPGPVEPAFEVGEITLESAADYSQLHIQIVNTGNVRIRPAGMVTVSDEDGNTLYRAPVSMGSVFARDSTSLVAGLPALPEGEYQIAVDLTDSETDAAATRDATVTATPPATPVPPPSVQIGQASGTPRPTADDVQFLDVAATIDNAGEPLTNVQVTLRVTKDGELVEDFPLATSLTVATGQTPIQERYVPITGWSSGTWAFTLSVEAVDPGTGIAQVLATIELDELDIP
ncbi:MAG: hypothetical protein ACRDJW_22165 [Thermomicrobiales bacterium]